MQDYIVDKSCLKNWLFPIVISSDNVHSVENAFGGDYIAVIISNGWLLACCHIACWGIWHSFLLLPHVHSICFTPQSPSLSVMIGIWIYHCNETLTHSGLSKKSVGVVYTLVRFPNCHEWVGWGTWLCIRPPLIVGPANITENFTSSSAWLETFRFFLLHVMRWVVIVLAESNMFRIPFRPLPSLFGGGPGGGGGSRSDTEERRNY